MNPFQQAIALLLGTFVSEDLACISAGLLIHAGHLSWLVGVGACLLGIFLGDLGLWLTGRLAGGWILRWSWVRRRLPAQELDGLRAWFDAHGWKVVLTARFVPGMRLPVYLAAGMLGGRAGRFAGWSLLAAAVWTPLLVLSVALFGRGIVAPLERFLGGGWPAIVTAAVVVWVAVRVTLRAAAPLGRARLWASVSRIWRWEFWPAWLFYIPLVPWIGILALRHRGLATATAANPGIVPHGGVVGESKFAILSKLPQQWVVPSALIPAGELAARVEQLRRLVTAGGWNYPLILKPDAGQRGAGVRRVCDEASAERYLAQHSQPVLAQAYHPGPFEAGIFYYRMPDQPHGRIFSITDKQFPVLVGDGVSSVESLLWRHPRLRMQAKTFLARLNGQAGTVPDAGRELPLVLAGNHCQGTLFRDGAHLLTPELERTVDRIARQFDGFFFGRFDVRYSDADELRAGRGLAIVELNGVTSESTNIYDPAWSLLRAYRVLMRQWAILFAIGDRNRRMGHRPSRLSDVLSDVRAFYRDRRVSPLSD